MEHTPLHHHPRDGGLRPDCKRCQLEAAAPEMKKLLGQLANEMQVANSMDDRVYPGWFTKRIRRIEKAIAKATK